MTGEISICQNWSRSWIMSPFSLKNCNNIIWYGRLWELGLSFASSLNSHTAQEKSESENSIVKNHRAESISIYICSNIQTGGLPLYDQPDHGYRKGRVLHFFRQISWAIFCFCFKNVCLRRKKLAIVVEINPHENFKK